MAKRIFGVIFIILGILLSCSTVLRFPEIIKEISKLTDDSITASESGAISGYIVAQIIVIAVIIVLFKVGSKWVKTKKSN